MEHGRLLLFGRVSPWCLTHHNFFRGIFVVELKDKQGLS